MIILKSILGNKLRKIRKENNETLNVVSAKTNIALALLSKIERGDRIATSEQLLKLSIYYGYNITELNILMTAEKIIREYGISHQTYDSIKIVQKQIEEYLIK
jgi:transcriptional regulator with XRE-family HTH domain